MDGSIDETLAGDGLRERKAAQCREEQGNGMKEEVASKEKAARYKRTIGKTPDGSGESKIPMPMRVCKDEAILQFSLPMHADQTDILPEWRRNSSSASGVVLQYRLN